MGRSAMLQGPFALSAGPTRTRSFFCSDSHYGASTMAAYGSTVSPFSDASLQPPPDSFYPNPPESVGGSASGQRDILQAHVRRFNTAAGDLIGVWKPHQIARVFWSVVVAGAVLVGLPVLVLHLASNLASIRVYLVLISTMFVALAVPISLYSIRRHLVSSTYPDLFHHFKKPILTVLFFFCSSSYTFGCRHCRFTLFASCGWCQSTVCALFALFISGC
jgi:hypothetical protein